LVPLTLELSDAGLSAPLYAHCRSVCQVQSLVQCIPGVVGPEHVLLVG
jgi:hypothetical protein